MTCQMLNILGEEISLFMNGCKMIRRSDEKCRLNILVLLSMYNQVQVGNSVQNRRQV